jgi:hypothetical protein
VRERVITGSVLEEEDEEVSALRLATYGASRQMYVASKCILRRVCFLNCESLEELTTKS